MLQSRGTVAWLSGLVAALAAITFFDIIVLILLSLLHPQMLT